MMSACMVYVYLFVSTPDDIINLLGALLDEMRAKELPTSFTNLDTTTTMNTITASRHCTNMDDESVTYDTIMASSHLERRPTHVRSRSTDILANILWPHPLG